MGPERFNQGVSPEVDFHQATAGGHHNQFAEPGRIIYAANEDGKVFVFPASPSFDLVGMGELVRATQAVSNIRLYIRPKTTCSALLQPRD